MAKRIVVRVSNPRARGKSKHRAAPRKRRAAATRRRRRNPGQQLSFAQIAQKHTGRAKHLRRPSKKGRFISKIAKKKGKRYAPSRKRAPSSSSAAVRPSPRYEQLTLEQALQSVPRVNRRMIGARPIVVVAGGSSASSSAKSHSAKRRKKKAVRKAARKGGTMARAKHRRRRRSSGRKRGHRRIRCTTYKRNGKIFARRRNPSLPAPVGAGLGVLVGAAAGIGISVLADKFGIGSPTVRNYGLIGAGVAVAALGHKVAPGASTAIGAGVAALGGLRQFQTVLYAQPAPATTAAPVSGLGTGDGVDLASAFAALTQGGSVFDRVGNLGQVIEGMGEVVPD